MIRVAVPVTTCYNSHMETITRNVGDLQAHERSAVEQLVGHRLRENQQLIIQVVSIDMGGGEKPNGSQGDELPPWCNVYEGLNDEQIAEIEKSIVRTPGSRTFN